MEAGEARVSVRDCAAGAGQQGARVAKSIVLTLCHGFFRHITCVAWPQACIKQECFGSSPSGRSSLDPSESFRSPHRACLRRRQACIRCNSDEFLVTPPKGMRCGADAVIGDKCVEPNVHTCASLGGEGHARQRHHQSFHPSCGNEFSTQHCSQSST